MTTNRIAHVAALVGEPARTAMLLTLLDGKALAAMELARAGNVGAATASRHLAQMVDAGLLEVTSAGRHRYYRLASTEVARMLEGIMQVAGLQTQAKAVVTGPKEAAMRQARTCYDHIAGRLGVAIADHLVASGAVLIQDESAEVTAASGPVLAPLGIDPAQAVTGASNRRVPCRPCMDWSERRYHVAGRLGQLICAHSLERGWLVKRGRALDITPAGATTFQRWLGLPAWRSVVEPG